MARQKRVQSGERAIDMTPMIDVVFQLIIFFIVTINLDEKLHKPIELADAEDSPPIIEKDPRTVIITVEKNGQISIASRLLSAPDLYGILQNAVNREGFEIPVLVRGDTTVKHRHIRAVMDACAGVGLWKIKLAAMKEEARET